MLWQHQRQFSASPEAAVAVERTQYRLIEIMGHSKNAKNVSRIFSLRTFFIVFIALSIVLGLALAFPYSENSQSVLDAIHLGENKSISLRLHKIVPRFMKIPVTRYYLDVRENGELKSLTINPDRRFYDPDHIKIARSTLKDSHLIIVFTNKDTPTLLAVYEIDSDQFVIGDKLSPELNFLAHEASDPKKTKP